MRITFWGAAGTVTRSRFVIDTGGHILGAASVRLPDDSTSVVFTGDVGRPADPVMRPPEPLPIADHVVTESTYGNRTHAPTDPLDELAEVANRTLDRGGALLIRCSRSGAKVTPLGGPMIALSASGMAGGGPGPAPPRTPGARSPQHRPVRRLPGRRHPGSGHARRRGPHQDLRLLRAGPSRGRRHRRPLGPRRQ